MKKIPEQIITERLVLRQPRRDDAEEVFKRYASDADVTKYMSWPQHDSVQVTEEVVTFWLKQWDRTAGGAYLITHPDTGQILGSTGFDLINTHTASTGYVFAKDQWGKGYATEALKSMVDLADEFGTQRLYAYCHHEHKNSAHVLEKCGFEFEGKLRNYIEFPNLTPGEFSDVLMFAWIPTKG